MRQLGVEMVIEEVRIVNRQTTVALARTGVVPHQNVQAFAGEVIHLLQNLPIYRVVKLAAQRHRHQRWVPPQLVQ